ncbi:Retrotransposon polyprotein [Penicillium concentricum]|uniref:Retrotransposon polyprotein n=1 Tax=Penicillium concentricum TaxID=293559 RepID=A0A9W9VIB5_9EURO|nr:Retrotransposon polyprotein [Penicillium concentricum]KAJ5383318.1 Retrotransposon polyprotein [Penicillium concentricum]
MNKVKLLSDLELYIRDYYEKAPKDWLSTTTDIFNSYDLPDRVYIPYFEVGLKLDIKDKLARIDRLETLD